MQNDARNEARTQVQETVRQAIRDALRAQQEVAQVTDAGRAQTIALLQAQIEGAHKEITTLTQQLTPDLSRAREQAIEGQLERATEHLQGLEAQLRTATGVETRFETQLDAPGAPANVIPEDAKEIAIWGTSIVAVTIVSVAFIRMWSRWLDRRSHAPAAGPDLTPRLDRIEQAIEAVAIEVERISEGQRYTSKMLHDARALPAPGLPDRWPAAAEREPVPARRLGED